MVREIEHHELNELLELYTHLHETDIPEMTESLRDTWDQIIGDKNHHVIVNEVNGKIVASCVCVIIPNLTRGVRPYAFIENVVTHLGFRRNGYATQCLEFAKSIAQRENCYKIMLLTGATDVKMLDFYRKAGYNSNDKTAFIQWLE